MGPTLSYLKPSRAAGLGEGRPALAQVTLPRARLRRTLLSSFRASFLELYLDLQSTQNNGLYTLYFGMKALIFGTLEVQVPVGSWRNAFSDTLCSTLKLGTRTTGYGLSLFEAYLRDYNSCDAIGFWFGAKSDAFEEIWSLGVGTPSCCKRLKPAPANKMAHVPFEFGIEAIFWVLCGGPGKAWGRATGLTWQARIVKEMRHLGLRT